MDAAQQETPRTSDRPSGVTGPQAPMKYARLDERHDVCVPAKTLAKLPRDIASPAPGRDTPGGGGARPRPRARGAAGALAGAGVVVLGLDLRKYDGGTSEVSLWDCGLPVGY